ncbi:hypothetical protein [Natrarchaeobaculum sulfurireducens]
MVFPPKLSVIGVECPQSMPRCEIHGVIGDDEPAIAERLVEIALPVDGRLGSWCR